MTVARDPSIEFDAEAITRLERGPLSRVPARPGGPEAWQGTLAEACEKSLSLIMGWGSRPLGRETGTGCDYCTMRNRCTYRCRRAGA
jgi:hypothetical protein